LSDGEYFVNDKSVAELARGVLKSKVSIVTQDFNKYYFTVKRNIVITKNPLHVDHELYKKVKEICEIDKFMKRIDLKDDQVLGKLFVAGREISPGLWQRLSIARALYRNREVLVLDEPFTFIDEESRRVILRNIFKFLGKGRSLLYISQNSENSEMFDKIYYLKSGRLIRVK
jgi:ATP-binding cassette subfamily B protein